MPPVSTSSSSKRRPCAAQCIATASGRRLKLQPPSATRAAPRASSAASARLASFPFDSATYSPMPRAMMSRCTSIAPPPISNSLASWKCIGSPESTV